jgi:hypothetical protein
MAAARVSLQFCVGVAASVPAAADSTKSLIPFCKQIDRGTAISGKINCRDLANYPAASAGSGF